MFNRGNNSDNKNTNLTNLNNGSISEQVGNFTGTNFGIGQYISPGNVDYG